MWVQRHKERYHRTAPQLSVWASPTLGRGNKCHGYAGIQARRLREDWDTSDTRSEVWTEEQKCWRLKVNEDEEWKFGQKYIKITALIFDESNLLLSWSKVHKRWRNSAWEVSRGRKGIKEQWQRQETTVSKSDYMEHKSCHKDKQRSRFVWRSRRFQGMPLFWGLVQDSSPAEVWAGGRRAALATRTGEQGMAAGVTGHLERRQEQKHLQRLQMGIKLSRSKSRR